MQLDSVASGTGLRPTRCRLRDRSLGDKEMVALIVIDEISLKFNGGNKIGFNESSESYANFYRADGESYLIKISEKFHDFIFSII